MTDPSTGVIMKQIIFIFLCLFACLSNAKPQWRVVPINTGDGLKSIEFMGKFGWITEEFAFHSSRDQDTTGFLTTIDGGKTWVRNTTAPSKHLSKVEFVNSQVGWATARYDDGLFHTVDGGETWTTIGGELSLSTSFQSQEIDFVDEKNGWFLASGEVYRTQDGGQNWVGKRAPPYNYFHEDKIKFYDATSGWIIGAPSLFFNTTDGGETWTQRGVNEGFMITKALDLIAQNEVILATEKHDSYCPESGYSINIYHSADAGVTMADSYKFCSPYLLTMNDVDFVDSQHGWLAVGSQIISTDDGGKTWTKEYQLASSRGHLGYIKDIHMISSTEGWAISVDGFLLKYSEDAETEYCEGDNLATITESTSGHPVLHIPSLKYNAPWGMVHIEAHLIYSGADHVRNQAWRLLGYSELENPCVDSYTGIVDRDLAVHLPVLLSLSSSGGSKTEADFAFIGQNQSKQMLWHIDRDRPLLSFF